MAKRTKRSRKASADEEQAVFDLPRREAMSLLPTGLPTSLPGLSDTGGLLGGAGPTTSAVPAGTSPADAAKHLTTAAPQNNILDQNQLSPGATSSSGATQYSPVVQSDAPATD
jgi:hypothetical protein